MMNITKVFTEFFESEKAAGLVLIFCAAFSLFISNSGLAALYNSLWNIQIANHTIAHWINDGLMTIFFLLIGLELEREIYIGELSNIKESLLPIFAAFGGVLFPAGIYLFFNHGTDFSSGAGIPMATDIAFALGVLSLLGERVPFSLKIFLTALAVIDDLIAILIIAIFYSKTLILSDLFISLGVFALLLFFNFFRIKILSLYLLGGIAMWFFMLNSGIHATVAGVLLAFAIPFDREDTKSISYKLQHLLHKPVAFLVLPIFALANTAIHIDGSFSDIFDKSYSIGIAMGLFAGKPLGIFTLSFMAVKSGLCKLPSDINWKMILHIGFLGGIGFTMSIFITLLAFTDQEIINNSKLVIISSSLISAIVGFMSLKFFAIKN